MRRRTKINSTTSSVLASVAVLLLLNLYILSNVDSDDTTSKMRPSGFETGPIDDSLRFLIETEIKTIPTMPFVSWGGIYHMYRPILPPELDMLSLIGNRAFAPNNNTPVVEHLPSNTFVVTFSLRNGLRSRVNRRFGSNKFANRLNYTAAKWGERIVKDNAKFVGMYVMADEVNAGSEYLKQKPSPFSFVIRDYFFEKLKYAPEETTVVQLGTMSCRSKRYRCDVSPPNVVFTTMLASGVDHQLRPDTFIKASERPRKCYWAGSDRKGRKKMVKHFQKSGSCEVYLTPGFNQGHNKTVYADLLANTVFGLVPRGISPETHRLAEVLMFGGIPAMLDVDANAPHMLSYPRPIPLIQGPTWDVVEKRMMALSDDDLDELQQRVLDWWAHHWQCVHDDMKWIFAQAHAASEGRDLCAESTALSKNSKKDQQTAFMATTFSTSGNTVDF